MTRAGKIATSVPLEPSRLRPRRDQAQRCGLLVAWIILLVFFSILRPDQFGTVRNIQTILSSQSVVLVLALASMLPLIVGELDLSLGGILGASSMLLGWLNVVHGWPIWLAVTAVLCCGGAIGLVNAFLVVVVRIDSIAVTLGMGTLLAGLALAIKNLPIVGISTGLVSTLRFRAGGLQVSFYVAAALALAIWYILKFTPLGRHLYFVGAGRRVARLSGLRVGALRMGAFLGAGVIAALAGVMLAGLLGSSDPNSGVNLLLPALAGVFLGATAFTPGRFNAAGTFVAVYFLVTGITGLEIVGYSGWVISVFYGGSLIAAVVLSRVMGRQ
ncbi:ABC transporter permease [Kribbella ginsengisoli]|uniref:Sugar ABC transporter permease n=1 Tax=Kribbella ginsengisoli TaxID=363865 RepID=A0ABP6Z502_9ACTN